MLKSIHPICQVSKTWADLLFGDPTSVEKQDTQNSVPNNSLVKIHEVCAESEITKDDNQISPVPSGQQEDFPHLDENRNERQTMSKISHAGRTKEGLDNDRFEKRSGCGKKDWKRASFSERRVVFRKRLGRFGSKAKGNRSLRKRLFKMILEAKQEERKAERSEDTSQDGQPCGKATPSKTTDNNNSWSTSNAKKPKPCFSRKTGKTIQNQTN